MLLHLSTHPIRLPAEEVGQTPGPMQNMIVLTVTSIWKISQSPLYLMWTVIRLLTYSLRELKGT
jgi:hypothetical protein